MTRLLGIDLGERRIGLAVGDSDGASARPLATVARGRDLAADAATIGRVAREQRVDVLVVGLPLDADGSEGAMASAARAWAEALALAVGVPAILRDERLSSQLAEERLGPMPRGRSGGPPTPTQRDRYRARVDREAAAIILQSELDARTADLDASRAGHAVSTPSPGAPR